MKTELIVEAALFSAGKPVSLEEIQNHTGLTKKQIKTAITKLQETYKERETALEVGPAGDKWSMHVKSKASEAAAKFAPMEIPVKLLRTLALVAYHQPLKQSSLKDMIGSKVYDHVKELKETGLVTTRKEGQTKILHTTPQFPEYFGIEGASKEEIKQHLASLVPRALPTLKLPEHQETATEAAEGAPETADLAQEKQ